MPSQTEELDLMQRVKRLAGPYLDVFGPTTIVPIEFWAALTANETGAWLIRNTSVPSHFDQNIFDIFTEVQGGGRAHWGSITTAMLDGVSDSDLRAYCSSHGLTQVEGYNILEWPGVTIDDLNDPAKHYQLAARLLNEDLEHFALDPLNDFEAMFRSWNSGSPVGKTYDPDYASNGLRRMEIWKQLPVQQ